MRRTLDCSQSNELNGALVNPNLVRLFLAEGLPNGLRTIELSNTTIIGTLFPRSSIDTFAQRDAAQKPGVYLLVGLDQNDQLTRRVYVGEGDPVLPRLRSHVAKKDFWTQAIVFTSKDDYLTKTQIQFLESSVIAKIKAAARAIMDNGSIPSLPNIAAPERSEVEYFLDVMTLLLAAVGIDILEPRIATSPIPKGELVYSFSSKKAKARMVITPQGYVILKNSTAVCEGRPSAASYISRMRLSLVDAGILKKRSDNLYFFSAETPFDSSSTAASVVAGGNVNGRMKWKLPNGRTLKQMEEASAEKDS